VPANRSIDRSSNSPARQGCRSRGFRPVRSGGPQSWYSEMLPRPQRLRHRSNAVKADDTGLRGEPQITARRLRDCVHCALHKSVAVRPCGIRVLTYIHGSSKKRFNRRSRGKLFFRLVQQALALEPVPLDRILHPEAKVQARPQAVVYLSEADTPLPNFTASAKLHVPALQPSRYSSDRVQPGCRFSLTWLTFLVAWTSPQT
jgi:hypothetical protein